MKASRVRNIFIVLLSIYTIFVVGFYFLAGEQLRYKEFKDADIPEADSITPEIIEGIEVKQHFVNKVDRINTIEIVFTKFYRDGNGKVTVSLIDEDTNEVFIKETLNVLDIPEQHRIYLEAEEPIEGLKNETLTLSITSNCKEGEGVAVMMNEETEGSYIMAGGKILDGTLCFAVVGTVFISLSDYYWFIMGGLGITLAAIFLVSYLNFVKGKYNYIIVAIYAIERYRFLISQNMSTRSPADPIPLIINSVLTSPAAHSMARIRKGAMELMSLLRFTDLPVLSVTLNAESDIPRDSFITGIRRCGIMLVS